MITPCGWFRVCTKSEIEKKKKLTLSFLWGDVEVIFNQTIVALIKTLDQQKWMPLTVKEENSLILAWFPNSEPQFNIHPVGHFDRKGWSKPFHFMCEFNSNLIEIAENAVDMGHFTSVHVYHQFAKLKEYWTEGPKMRVIFESARRIGGILFPVHIELHYQGLGWIESNIKSHWLEAYVVYTPVSLSPERVSIQLSVSFKKTRNFLWNLILRLILPWEVRRDYVRDIPIWENKITHQYPKLCKNDGPIIQLRKWTEQFYPLATLTKQSTLEVTSL